MKQIALFLCMMVCANVAFGQTQQTLTPTATVTTGTSSLAPNSLPSLYPKPATIAPKPTAPVPLSTSLTSQTCTSTSSTKHTSSMRIKSSVTQTTVRHEQEKDQQPKNAPHTTPVLIAPREVTTGTGK